MHVGQASQISGAVGLVRLGGQRQGSGVARRRGRRGLGRGGASQRQHGRQRNGRHLWLKSTRANQNRGHDQSMARRG